jgi:hypothetical protein
MLLTAVKASRTAEETLRALQLSNDRVKGTRKCPSQLDGIKYGGTGGNVCHTAFTWFIKPAENPRGFLSTPTQNRAQRRCDKHINSCTSVDKSHQDSMHLCRFVAKVPVLNN